MKRKISKLELIGMNVEIIDAKNKSLIGIKGKIIDETKNTFSIETKNKIKKVLKNQIKLRIKALKKTIETKGDLFKGRPEDRIKK